MEISGVIGTWASLSEVIIQVCPCQTCSMCSSATYSLSFRFWLLSSPLDSLPAIYVASIVTASTAWIFILVDVEGSPLWQDCTWGWCRRCQKKRDLWRSDVLSGSIFPRHSCSSNLTLEAGLRGESMLYYTSFLHNFHKSSPRHTIIQPRTSLPGSGNELGCLLIFFKFFCIRFRLIWVN